MSAASARPTAGARFAVVLAEKGAEKIVYRGFVHLPDTDLPLEVTLDLPEGKPRALLTGGTPELEKVAAALIRAATKAELATGSPLPRKIVRWRS